MIRVKNVDVVKSGTKLYKNFSWDIADHENWVITGRNGTGKTLLLEALAGILHLSKGAIEYDFITGKTWDERYAERKKKITYVPADALHTFLNGRHELFYQQRYYGLGDEKIPTVKEVLGESLTRLFDLNIPSSLSIVPLLDLEVTRLSNGQLKKVLLIKSFLKGMPNLLLLDYPFEGLDHESREDLCKFIDFISANYEVQIVLVDHHHHLPSVINRKLTLGKFFVESSEKFRSVSQPEFQFRQSPLKRKGDNEVVLIQNLQLRYGARQIFSEFNWTVNRGDRWVLVGRNGTGKTTLFSMIFADHPMAYTQKIYLFGRRRGTGESIWDIKRRINYLGPEQMSYLNLNGAFLTAREYVKSMNQKLDIASLESLAEYFQVQDFIDKPLRFLSSGELQLILIINCFLSEKELLLLDEPFRFLDNVQKERVTQYILSHLKADTTLILITHYKDDIPVTHSLLFDTKIL
jgi:molybdate transport system ATP-binding protein